MKRLTVIKLSKVIKYLDSEGETDLLKIVEDAQEEIKEYRLLKAFIKDNVR